MRSGLKSSIQTSSFLFIIRDLVLECKNRAAMYALELFKHRIAVLLTLGTGIDYRMHQSQFIEALGAWWLHVINQLF